MGEIAAHAMPPMPSPSPPFALPRCAACASPPGSMTGLRGGCSKGISQRWVAHWSTSPVAMPKTVNVRIRLVRILLRMIGRLPYGHMCHPRVSSFHCYPLEAPALVFSFLATSAHPPAEAMCTCQACCIHVYISRASGPSSKLIRVSLMGSVCP